MSTGMVARSKPASVLVDRLPTNGLPPPIARQTAGSSTGSQRLEVIERYMASTMRLTT
jgi:hypothetical protein